MGIVNVTDDSFCDDGSLELETVLQRVSQSTQAGADIIDLGGESARTNRGPITVREEIDRLQPVLDALPNLWPAMAPRDDEQIWPPLVSVNSWRHEVVAEVLPLGVDLLNDISGLTTPDNARLCAAHGTSLLIMHTVGLPKVAQLQQEYEDIWQALFAFFDERIAVAKAAGLTKSQLVLDPGIDFAKQRRENLAVFRHLDRLAERYELPILLPISRKTVIGEVLNLPDPKERDAGTMACLVSGLLRGAAVFRVHEVKAMYQALRVLRPIVSKGCE